MSREPDDPGGRLDLNWLLAGPILRRAEPTRVCVWLATSAPARVRGEVFRLRESSGRVDMVGDGDAETVRIGRRLFVHLVSLRPRGDGFPTDEILAYDLVLGDEQGREHRLEDVGLLGGFAPIVYPGLPLPSFFLRAAGPELTILHGSCRQLHGGGEDALVAADWHVGRHALDPQRRACALFLTGDQIYADEVAGPLLRHIGDLGWEMIGLEADVPGVPPLREIPIYGRQQMVTKWAKLTSVKAFNHLMGLGEFAAMYVTAWNEATWPARFPRPEEAVREGETGAIATAVARRKYAAEARGLERTRRALPRVRRLLANTPTYMIFDDHDVTDDWNITAAWREAVWTSATGRRIVANALGTYWAFQDWGNDPERESNLVRAAVAGRADGTVTGDAFDRALWGHERWSFHAPTHPPTIFVDTRTQRAYDSREGGARLLSERGRNQVLDVAKAAGHDPGQPLLMVSPAPVCGLEIVERHQRYLARQVGPYAIDFEAWHSNLQGFVDLIHLLVDDLQLPWAVMLSGDVHYGFTVNVTVESGGSRLPITQLVSSAVHHSGGPSRYILGWLGLLSREKHERIGWDHPPRLERQTETRRRLLERPPNTDSWREDAPVFVDPRTARLLGVVDEPRYREWRTYARLEEIQASLVGLNNVGLVSLRDGSVVHRLLVPGSDRVRAYTASVEASRDDSAGNAPSGRRPHE